MCGILGIINLDPSETKSGMRWFEAGLLVTQLRGVDSTGVLVVDKATEEVTCYKRALRAADFLQLKSTQDILKLIPNSKMTLGHTRAATVGRINDGTAHPHSAGHIHLTHNGTLLQYRDLPEFVAGMTDSQLVTELLRKYGIKETTSKLYGALTLAWWDDKEHSANLYSNNQRPLHYVKVPDTTLYIYASEAWVITGLLGSLGIKCPVPTPVGTNEHIKFTYTKKKGVRLRKTVHKCRELSTTWGTGTASVTPWTGTVPKSGIRYDNAAFIDHGIQRDDPIEFFCWNADQEEELKKLLRRYEGVPLDEECPFDYVESTDTTAKLKTGRVKGKIYGISIEGNLVTAHVHGLVQVSVEPLDTTDNSDMPQGNTGTVVDTEEQDGSTLTHNGPRGKATLTETEYIRKTAYGCAMCSCTLFPQKHHLTQWTVGGDPLCDVCAAQLLEETA